MATSRPHSRPRTSRTSSSVPPVPQPESLILQDGPVGEEAAELLNDLVHPRHHAEETLVGSSGEADDTEDESKRRKLPWWKRPSPYWMLAAIPFSAIASSATLAPRIEIYTMLACSVHKPDIFKDQQHPGIDIDSIFSRSSEEPIFTISETLPAFVKPVYFNPTFDKPSTNESTPPPSRRNKCAADPTVQAAVAKLSAVIAGCMGVLSFITTGWWGAFSDRHGRSRVMGISITGLLLTEFNFIFVTKFFRHVPGGYWFLVVGPTVEGLLGGFTSGVAAVHAYLADTTNDENRSRIFSLNLGLMFTGFAIGPTLGSLLIRWTGSVLSVFVYAATCHMLYTLLVWFILPESVSDSRRSLAKANFREEQVKLAQEREGHSTKLGRMLFTIGRLFTSTSPLSVFSPWTPETAENPLKRRKKDWNLALMAVGYGFTISIMGSYSYKFQYAAAQFGWSTEIIGYWLSLVGLSRAFFLTAVLPLAIKIFKPKPIIIEIPAPVEPSSLAQSDTPPSPPETIKKEIHSPSFELRLAQISLIVEVIAYSVMAISPTALTFTAFSLFSSFGTGYSPAVQSVMLALYTGRGGKELGRLFGALSVTQALSSQILGPAIYGWVYIKTVATLPRAIFFVTVASIVVSFLLTWIVTLPSESDLRAQGGTVDVEDIEESRHAEEMGTHGVQEATLVGDDDSSDSTPLVAGAQAGDGARKRYGATTHSNA